MFQVHRTDTGQFVFIDPATGTVVIEDALEAGYERIEAASADAASKSSAAPPPATTSESAFAFGGSRGLALVLSIGLPFVWFAFVYLALRDLDRPPLELQRELDALRIEVEALRQTVESQPPRSSKGGVVKPKKRPKPKPKPKTPPEPTPEAPPEAGAQAPTPPASGPK